jgi:DNA polymerase I-like protein with 3'-5' exonuclease and polymerase domains
MKKALVLLDQRMRELGVNAKFVANVHDEWQIECPEVYADIVGKAAVQSIRDAGVAYNLKCPLDGEYKVGLNWRMTH